MNHRRLLRRVLLGVVALALAATVAIFFGYRRITRQPDLLLDQLQKEADMQLQRVRQTAMKNGIEEWRLDAESATLLEKEGTMQLVKPEVAFFMKDGSQLHLTADRGILYTATNRIQVTGQVAADTPLYRFRTETLDYDPQARELHADTPVTLSSESFSLKADTMTMSLENQITRFEGRVEGILSEDFQL